MNDSLIDLYAAGRLSPPVARMFEDRVTTDTALRGEAEHLVPVASARMAANLDAILGATIAPRRSLFERAALRLGVREQIARVLAATPALRFAWCAAVFVVLVVASAAGDATDRSPQRLAPFLALAPVVSVLGVALSYGSFGDRSHEVASTTPLAGLRLLLIRTTAVLAAAISVSGLAAVLAPSKGLIQLVWLLPTLALTGVTLALGIRFSVQHAAIAVSLAWLIVVVAVGQSSSNSVATFGLAGQVACGAVTVLAAIIVGAKRRHYDQRGPT